MKQPPNGSILNALEPVQKSFVLFEMALPSIRFPKNSRRFFS
jgi:hypothetical protein